MCWWGGLRACGGSAAAPGGAVGTVPCLLGRIVGQIRGVVQTMEDPSWAAQGSGWASVEFIRVPAQWRLGVPRRAGPCRTLGVVLTWVRLVNSGGG